jgi:hypothetical protein
MGFLDFHIIKLFLQTYARNRDPQQARLFPGRIRPIAGTCIAAHFFRPFGRKTPRVLSPPLFSIGK